MTWLFRMNFALSVGVFGFNYKNNNSFPSDMYEFGGRYDKKGKRLFDDNGNL